MSMSMSMVPTEARPPGPVLLTAPRFACRVLVAETFQIIIIKHTHTNVYLFSEVVFLTSQISTRIKFVFFFFFFFCIFTQQKGFFFFRFFFFFFFFFFSESKEGSDLRARRQVRIGGSRCRPQDIRRHRHPEIVRIQTNKKKSKKTKIIVAAFERICVLARR
jgi:hypothetical protein